MYIQTLRRKKYSGILPSVASSLLVLFTLKSIIRSIFCTFIEYPSLRRHPASVIFKF